DLNVVASHAMHNGFLAPNNTKMSSTMVQAAASTFYRGSVILTIGCHTGLNVPKVDSGSGPNTLDLASVFASKGAVYMANTGYGYGDSDHVALSEQYLSLVVQQMGRPGGVSMGEAIWRAKQAYIQQAGSNSFGALDEKALAISTFYGIPSYRV